MEGSSNISPFQRPHSAANYFGSSGGSMNYTNSYGKRYYRGIQPASLRTRRPTGSFFRPVRQPHHDTCPVRQPLPDAFPVRQPLPDTPTSLSDCDDHKQTEAIIECAAYCGDDTCHDFVELPCKHRLHRNCLETLLCQRIGRCPVCRGSLDSLRRARHHFKIAEECEAEFIGNFRVVRLNSLEAALESAPEGGQACPVAVAQLVQLTGMDDATVRRSLKVAHGNSDEAATILFDLLEWKED